MARFKASARILDEKIGVVLTALGRSGLAENTLVICTMDHGIPFPRMKCNLHDSGIGTMLLMRGSSGFTGGKVIDTMTSHLDIFLTLCDLLGIDPPTWLRGKSIMPLIDDEVATLHNALFFEVNYHAAYEPMRAVCTSRWKYIKRFDDPTTPILPNCDDGESKSVWLAHGWRETAVPHEQLYDLIFDPKEINNLASDAASQPVLNEMRERLAQWMQETDDPLLSGAVRPPVGAVVNNRDSFSATEPPETAVFRHTLPLKQIS